MSRMRHSGLAAITTLAAVFCFSLKILASGVVTNATESALVAAMNGGGTVTLAVNGTIYLTNTLIVSNNTVMDATGYNVAISGSNTVQIMIVNSNTTLAMTNLTLENGLEQFLASGGTGGGGAISNAGTLQMVGCTFIKNSTGGMIGFQVVSEGDGGAIYSTGTLQATACTFNNNSAVGNTSIIPSAGVGGAIYNAGIMTALNCAFAANSVEGGNGITETMGGVTEPGGAANGGAAYNANQATFINCVFSNNTATGGVGDDPGSWYGITPLPGKAGGAANGGALCNAGNLLASNSLFVQNVATGGIGGEGGADTTGTTESGTGNPGGTGGMGGMGAGAAACCLAGSCMLVNDTFCTNMAYGGAGGTGGNGGPPSYHGTGSQGGNGGNGGQGGNALGGAICAQAGSILALNVTVASNGVAPGVGGAGGAGYFGPPSTTGSPGQTGSAGAARADAVANTSGVLTLKNSILSPNAPTNTNIYGSIVDAGNNIDSILEAALTNSTSLNGVNPMLAPLGNNGGPTPTMALLPGSPAIDAADPTDFPATDQRGVPRPFGPAPDIGAFENNSSCTISGQIIGLMSADHATVTSGHISTLTTNGGAYSFLIDAASYTISPSNANYVFVPPSQNVTLASNQTDVNFQAFRLNAITLEPPSPGFFNLAFAGTNGQPFTVETSTNCLSWAPMATNVIGSAGYLELSFPMSNSGGHFFRLVSPMP